MREALAGIAGATLVFAADGDAVAALRAASAASAMMLLVIDPTVSNLDKAMLLAAVGVLAIELAPAGRIAALDLGEGADSGDVVAAAAFLIAARSTTGQILQIG